MHVETEFPGTISRNLQVTTSGLYKRQYTECDCSIAFYLFHCFLRKIEMPSATVPVDLVAVLAIKAVVVDDAGKQQSTDAISVSFADFEMKTKTTAPQLAQCLCETLRPKFVSSIMPLTQVQSLHVKGILSEKMSPGEAFDITVGRALGLVVRAIRLHGEPGAVAVPGLQVKNDTAVVTLFTSSLAESGTCKMARGKGSSMLTAKVRDMLLPVVRTLFVLPRSSSTLYSV
jgi:hypothetical protein